MDRVLQASSRITLLPQLRLWLEAAVLLAASGLALYFLVVSTYAPVHDALHSFRHSLAIVPCH
ncbi:MAG: CbtB domain-containing protein [Candidatus Binatia bacterium]